MHTNQNLNPINLAALSNGEKNAYAIAFKLYYAGLCGFAERIVGENHAEDVVASVFLRLWEHNQQFENEVHLKAFLYRSVKNACLNLIKMSDRAENRNQFFYADKVENEQDYLLEITRVEVISALYNAISNLPLQAGKIIKLTYLEGLTNQQAADALGLSIQTIKNQKLRGLAMLKQRLPKEQYILLLALPAVMVLHAFGK